MTTINPTRSVIVVGGGLAGFTTARELRSRGFDGTVRIVDPEGLPYDRPPLSKAYLADEVDAEAIRLVPESWYNDNSVEVVAATVSNLSADRSTVVLGDGTELSSDAVVLATGGSARRLPILGGDLPGVLTLRNRGDADRLREAVRPGARLVIVGAGLIGAEVASTAAAHGARVTVVDPVPVPLVPAVGEELAEVLHGMHAENGVDVVLGVPSRIIADGSRLLVEVEQRAGHGRIAADVVLAAIGSEVDTTLADSAGLAVTDAVETTPDGLTSTPGIWAAGDGARVRLADGTLLRRSEHWEAAMLGGTVVACGILGQEQPERPPSWFWSDRYGVHVEAAGSMNAPGSTVLRGGEDRQVLAFRVDREGVLVGCAAIDGGKALRAARRLIARGARVGLDDLTDPAVDLRKVGKK